MNPLDTLKHHVSGAIARGEKTAITESRAKGKPVFFCLMRGLRGCYMPDDVAHYAVRSLDEFKRVLLDEARTFELSFIFPAEHADCADEWRELWNHAQRGRLELCAAVDPENAGYGLTVSTSTRADYLEYLRSMR